MSKSAFSVLSLRERIPLCFEKGNGKVITSEHLNKWIASDIPRGLATGLASEYNEKIPCIEIPCGPESCLLDAGSIRLAGGSLQ